MTPSAPQGLAFGTYPWHAPTVDMPGLVGYMSKKLGYDPVTIRDALSDEVFRVIAESNAYMKVYPPILKEHQFNAPVINRQWLNGTGLYDIFADFIESLRDDIDLLRKRVPGVIGLYTDSLHMRRCCETGCYHFPVIDERHIQDVRAWRGVEDKTNRDMVMAGMVFSQGEALILPEAAHDLLLKPWQCGEDIFVHKMPPGMLLFLRSM